MAHLKEEDDHHKRWGDERCVKAPSHELAHIPATEGTERGRRGGIAPAWVALNEVRSPAPVECSRIPFLPSPWVQQVGAQAGFAVPVDLARS